jgi:hypothetical protein
MICGQVALVKDYDVSIGEDQWACVILMEEEEEEVVMEGEEVLQNPYMSQYLSSDAFEGMIGDSEKR